MGSANESFEQERRVGRDQQYVEQFQRDFRAKLRDSLPAADLTFKGVDVGVTFPNLELVIRVDAVGGNFMPVTRMVVRLDEMLKGNLGEQRQEIRSARKTEQVNLDRVVGQVVETYMEVKPLYELRQIVKREVWQILGMDSREVENTRSVQYQGRKLWATLRWETDYVAGSSAGCRVGFELREPTTGGYSHDRKLDWSFPLDEVVNVVKFRQQLHEGMEKWDQEDQEKQQRESQKRDNETAATQLRNQYRDVESCSIEANPDNFRLTVWLSTEQDVAALMDWLRNRQQSGKE